MNHYIIDALAPLVFRSGKPFGAQSDTEDIVFPLPTASAGLIRTIFAQQQDNFSYEYNKFELQKIAVYGLFLVKLDDFGNVIDVFVPKPSDVLYLKNQDNQIELVRLSPQPLENGGCDLPHADLLSVQMETNIKGKPQSGISFWSYADFVKWQNGENLTFSEIEQRGTKLPEKDSRTHVAIDSNTLVGQDGKLFQTTAYDFVNPRRENKQGWEEHCFGFLIRTEQDLQNDWVKFGGEGRLSRLLKLENSPIWANAALTSDSGLKMTLLTPAVFNKGWLPDWIDEESLEGQLPHTDIKVKLRASAIERWLPISGWDLASHSPRATRKAVPAGSVYWFDIISKNIDKQQLTQFNHQSICINEQDVRDGFGIVFLANWIIK